MERPERTTPVFQAKLKGIRLAVFENITSDGRRWYSCSPSRQFQDLGTKEAKYATTFNGAADLVLLRELITAALSWLSARNEQGDED